MNPTTSSAHQIKHLNGCKSYMIPHDGYVYNTFSVHDTTNIPYSPPSVALFFFFNGLQLLMGMVLVDYKSEHLVCVDFVICICICIWPGPLN